MLLVKSDFGDEAANKLLHQDSKTCCARVQIFRDFQSCKSMQVHASLPFPSISCLIHFVSLDATSGRAAPHPMENAGVRYPLELQQNESAKSLLNLSKT